MNPPKRGRDRNVLVWRENITPRRTRARAWSAMAHRARRAAVEPPVSGPGRRPVPLLRPRPWPDRGTRCVGTALLDALLASLSRGVFALELAELPMLGGPGGSGDPAPRPLVVVLPGALVRPPEHSSFARREDVVGPRLAPDLGTAPDSRALEAVRLDRAVPAPIDVRV